MTQKPPEPQAMLCIDIGHQNTKAIAAVCDGDALVCHHAATVNLHQKQASSSLAECIGMLKEVFGSWKFRQGAVRVALGGDATTVRFIQVPNINKEQLLSNISLESGKYIPFPLKDTYYDCDVLGAGDGSKEAKARAVIAAVRRETVADLAKLLHGMGFVAEVLDVGPLAVFNAFELFSDSRAGAMQNVAILDIGQTKSHFGMVQNGVPAFARELDVGGVHFGKPAGAGPAPGFEPLAREIRKSFDFFEAEMGVPANGMILCGGGAMTDGLADFLRRFLEVPVYLWNPLESPKVRLEEGAVAMKPLGPQFAVCVGLAARTEKPSR